MEVTTVAPAAALRDVTAVALDFLRTLARYVFAMAVSTLLQLRMAGAPFMQYHV